MSEAIERPSREPVVVHLVHGTWPHGPFRRTGKRGKPAWFEDGSNLRASLAECAGVPLRFEIFGWSGNNSFTARARASGRLCQHLEDALTRSPNAAHVIVAHSHGGTVAAQALTGMEGDPHALAAKGEVAALVCLATPFSYAAPAGDHSGMFAGALSAIVTSMIGILIAFHYPPLLTVNVSLLLFVWIAVIGPLGLAIVGAARRLDKQDAQVLRQGMGRLYLMRATRDEAALFIGLSQSIHSIASLLFLRTQWSGKNARIVPMSFLLFCMWLAMLIGEGMTTALDGPLGLMSHPDHRGLFVVWSGSAALGASYIFCYALLAMSVGFWDLRKWPTRVIEVDLAPPMMPAVYKSYSELDKSQSDALRHGIYELAAVQRDLGLIIRAASEGRLRPDTLLNG